MRIPATHVASAGLGKNSMPDRAFLDTNILTYAQDAGAPEKQRLSREIIAKLADSGNGVISTQVMQEFFVAATRKLGVAPLAAKGILKTFAVFEIVQVSPLLIHEAIDCSILNQISFWDSLILATAASAGCSNVLSEDLNPGQTILGVKVHNPFPQATASPSRESST
jgi:predicted nucleic acid-binding protein